MRWTLIKAFLSSPEACIESLEHRIDSTGKALKGEEGPHPRAAALEKDMGRLREIKGMAEAVRMPGGGKLPRLIAELKQIGFDGGTKSPRVVIFSERIRTLDLLKAELTKAFSLKPEAVDVFTASTGDDVQQRELVESFGHADSRLRLLLCSDAASEGVNLHHQCHHLFHFDVPWSLIRLTQRNGRIDRFGQHETPHLAYLVLDELHTYDGAQGTDVACLIRRLGQRLGNPEAICPVGTSATIGTTAETRKELLDFAGTLFDQVFPEDAFIGETRVDPRDLLTGLPLPENYPREAGPWPAPGEDAEAHVRATVRAWFPASALDDILGTRGIDRVALGHWAVRIPLVRALLMLAHRKPCAAEELMAALGRELPAYGSASRGKREGWVASALSLISYAQRDVAGHALPLVNVQATLWVREVRRLLVRVGEEPAFRFYDDAPPPAGEAWLPRYACQDCGHSGWLVTESGPGDTLGFDYRVIGDAFRIRAPSLRLIHQDDSLVEHGDSAGRVAWLDAKGRRLLERATDEEVQPRVHVVEVEDGKLR